MNIYERKSRWKLWLTAFAAVIVVASLWYTNILAGKIAEEEQKQVRIWAQAVENKAQLVRYMNQLFARMADEERKKVQLWASAFERLNDPDNENIDPLVYQVFANNETVPVIWTDANDSIIATKNVEFDAIERARLLTPELKAEFTEYDPLVSQSQFQDEVSYIYYRDSKLFSELKVVIEDFVNSFITEDVMKAASVPVILTNEEGDVIEFSNIDGEERNDAEVAELLEEMRAQNEPIIVDLGESVNYIYYKDSKLLQQITLYPYIQLAIIGLFLVFAYFAFSTARKSEQNQVWVGMSKETAHQLGTPISSLMAWVEYFKETKSLKPDIVVEIEKDVNRLELVAERFSKIGSLPELQEMDVAEVLQQSAEYFKTRVSRKVNFIVDLPPEGTVFARINAPLFNWVIENLIKNALDAMEGSGELELFATTHNKEVVIEVSDSGKGIPKSKFKTVFQPGYSTKKRGWGLGLSLSKRIIENYHAGKIFVKESEPGQRTTFRIILPRIDK